MMVLVCPERSEVERRATDLQMAGAYNFHYVTCCGRAVSSGNVQVCSCVVFILGLLWTAYE